MSIIRLNKHHVGSQKSDHGLKANNYFIYALVEGDYDDMIIKRITT